MEIERRKKRSSRDDSSSKPDKKRSPSSSSPPRKRPTFASYTETPNLPPKIKLLCEILSTAPSSNVEASLDQTGIQITSTDVEEVLKLSYGFPGPSVKFFRWAGRKLHDNHTPYAWNLVVDLLGKNLLFEAMWDAIKSMNRERLLSLATFASVFSSYAVANRVDEAIMAFEVMDQYGCVRDIVALNSLMSAICREGKTSKAWDFLLTIKGRIRPDVDTYSILLEGWETEGDVVNAHKTFGEMVMLFGWNPANVPAYDAFLNTLLKGGHGREGLNETMKFFDVLKEKRCFPGMKFFHAAMDKLVKEYQTRDACLLWDGMVRSGCKPDTHMYNSMILLHCDANRVDDAYRFLDEMVFNGVFPELQTYNVMLKSFLKGRKLREASSIFHEMVKNEYLPNEENFSTAVKVSIDVGDPDMAIKVWKCMLENEISDSELEETGNLLIVGLRDLNRLPEARKYAEDMIERGIKLSSKTLSKLKQSLTTLGKSYAYEEILKKWKLKSH